jgi:hypothetical protein
MSNNSLRNLSSQLFHHLNRLETLTLENNPINETSRDSLKGLSKLQFLSLRNSDLGVELSPNDVDYKTILDRIPSARKLQQERRAVVILSVEALQASFLPNLTTLDLGRNRFSGIIRQFSPFASNQGLNDEGIEGESRQRRHASLDSNAHFDASIPSSHSSFPIILQDNNRASSSSPSSIIASSSSPLDSSSSSWTRLKELLLDGCSIEFIEASSFKGLVSLSILRIHDNSLTVSKVIL